MDIRKIFERTRQRDVVLYHEIYGKVTLQGQAKNGSFILKLENGTIEYDFILDDAADASSILCNYSLYENRNDRYDVFTRETLRWEGWENKFLSNGDLVKVYRNDKDCVENLIVLRDYDNTIAFLDKDLDYVSKEKLDLNENTVEILDISEADEFIDGLRSRGFLDQNLGIVARFKVGDRIQCGNGSVYRIEDIQENCYICERYFKISMLRQNQYHIYDPIEQLKAGDNVLITLDRNVYDKKNGYKVYAVVREINHKYNYVSFQDVFGDKLDVSWNAMRDGDVGISAYSHRWPDDWIRKNKRKLRWNLIKGKVPKELRPDVRRALKRKCED